MLWHCVLLFVFILLILFVVFVIFKLGGHLSTFMICMVVALVGLVLSGKAFEDQLAVLCPFTTPAKLLPPLVKMFT